MARLKTVASAPPPASSMSLSLLSTSVDRFCFTIPDTTSRTPVPPFSAVESSLPPYVACFLPVLLHRAPDCLHLVFIQTRLCHRIRQHLFLRTQFLRSGCGICTTLQFGYLMVSVLLGRPSLCLCFQHIRLMVIRRYIFSTVYFGHNDL